MPHQPPHETTSRVTRRRFLAAGAAAAAGTALFSLRRLLPAAPPPEAPVSAAEDVVIVFFDDRGKRLGPRTIPAVVKTDAEWRKQLSPLSYSVTRHADTEYPFSGALWKNHESGLYRCIGCDTALFTSATKFESGTGWPSFWQPLAPENIVEIVDQTFGMTRTAVSCRLCDAHQGHVFDDGPQPTGLRYCINSVSLRFVKFA